MSIKEALSQAVTVATGQNYGVKVTNVQINGADASSFSVQGNGCQGFTMGSGNTCQIYIQFQPTSAGAKQAQLEIDSDGTVSPLFVSLSGVGLHGPALTVNPTQAIFGDTKLGSSTSQTFTLTNTGDAPLQLQELFIVAGSPQVFPMVDGCSGHQLAAGAACQVTVGFIPIAPGVKDAALLVISNQAPVTVIGLSGTGVPREPIPARPPGPPGPTGPRGPAGKNGLVAFVTCKTITKTAPATRKKVTVSHVCTAKTVTQPIRLTTASVARAVLSRGRVVYATGRRGPRRQAPAADPQLLAYLARGALHAHAALDDWAHHPHNAPDNHAALSRRRVQMISTGSQEQSPHGLVGEILKTSEAAYTVPFVTET
ncbi:MAG: choice-of-anchor D domain-containing protein [Thermoproteota archaeon]|nr:choice-of-anchor D domain-containing protein [Thermoproteota archaeon]